MWDQVEGMTAWLDWKGRRYGWVALAPRRTGRPYTSAEHAAFEELVALLARAMWLLGGPERTLGGSDQGCAQLSPSAPALSPQGATGLG